jgi:methanogenic corrinoid protein MtbC1
VPEDLVKKIGGDVYVPNAAVAVKKARSLVER